MTDQQRFQDCPKCGKPSLMATIIGPGQASLSGCNCIVHPSSLEMELVSP